MSLDITFITNESGKTLRDRFAALLGTDTRQFDCLVGYFFISGFYKIYPSLEKVERVRILVGLNTDQTVWKLSQNAKAPSDEPPAFHFHSHSEVQKEIPRTMLRELEHAAYTAEVETGVDKFVQWIKSGKLQIRAHPSRDLHAKVYIVTFRDGDRDIGRVITGSSNLTQSGLQDNLEFNVELKNRSDYDFAIDKFNALWTGAVELSEPCKQAILSQSPYAQFTPYELYLKFLYEYFRSELNRPTELDDLYAPDGFKKLKYQEEAVLTAKRILEEYGGVFLSDVVGLGKTYMAAMLAQQLKGPSLVLAPPHLIDAKNPGSWRNVFRQFNVPQHTDFESIGTLDSLLQRDMSKYRNVFIDESHRFRNEDNQTYANLAQICRGKRVILVSATPLNNTPGDILSQIKLFQNGTNSTIPNVRNLVEFFGKLQRNLRGLDRRTHREQYLRTVQANAKATRESVLKYLMIRRTRGEVARYYATDLALQGVTFPDVVDPKALFYKFNKEESRILDSTMQMLGHDFKYARYKQLAYYLGEREGGQSQAQQNLAKFMKILMVTDPCLLFIFREQDRQAARRLAMGLRGTGNPSFPGFKALFRCDLEIDSSPIVLRDLSRNEMEKALMRVKSERQAKSGTLPVLILPAEDHDSYLTHKALFSQAKIPTQVCTLPLLQSDDSMKWAIGNIALQIFCKVGGQPWKVLPTEAERCLIIGISQSHKLRRVDGKTEVEKYFAFSVMTDSSGLFQKVQVLGQGDDKDGYLVSLRESLRDELNPDISSILFSGDLLAGPAPCKIKVLVQLIDFARRQGHVDRLYHKTHLTVISPAAESADRV